MDSERILNLILGECFNATTADDVLIYDQANGRFIVGGEPLPSNKSQEIIEAAHQLSNNILFDYLIKELEYDGTRRASLKSANWDEMRFPKANLYVAKLIKDKVETIKNLTVKPKKVENKTEKK